MERFVIGIFQVSEIFAALIWNSFPPQGEGWHEDRAIEISGHVSMHELFLTILVLPFPSRRGILQLLPVWQSQ